MGIGAHDIGANRCDLKGEGPRIPVWKMQPMTFALRAFETYAIIGGWMIFALLFLAHKRASAQPEKTRDRRSLVGMLFQGVGFTAVWSVRRGPWSRQRGA